MRETKPRLPAKSRDAGPACLRAVCALLAMVVQLQAALAQRAEITPTATELLRTAKSWGYQLQNIDVGKLARTSYDILVVDFPNGDGEGRIGKREVARLKRKATGERRIVLAYINIGEAEDYRYYWRKSWAASPPSWMGRQNCRWKGDHRVRHWAQEWQAIIFGSAKSYLGRILAAGFDGAWLDRVDIHRYWTKDRATSFADMVTFVERLSAWAKRRNPGFLVVPQNGEELLADATYRAAIDGLGKEDLLFGDHGNDAANEPARIERALSFISPVRAAGLPVLSVEYARAPAHRRLVLERHRALGFVPYIGPRSLAYLGTEGLPHPEDGDSEPLMEEAGGDGC
ncbi:MAG: endo alpha-1,4 polygalactosaminidase [Hyphomicrobiaceae bacterium]